MKLNKRIILVGMGGVGKDFFKDYLTAEGFVPSVSYTTRSKRKGEINGETYHFTCDTVFKEMISDDDFHEHKEFNGWSYGTTKHSFNNSDVFIFTPSGIKTLDKEELKESIIVYFDIPYEDRLERLMQRSDSDNVGRRINADTKDFMDFREWDIKVSNPTYCPEALLNTIIMFSKI